MHSCARRCGARSATLQQKLGITMVYVTHDQSEAMSMADQVILMREGKSSRTAAPDISMRGRRRCSPRASSARRR